MLFPEPFRRKAKASGGLANWPNNGNGGDGDDDDDDDDAC